MKQALGFLSFIVTAQLLFVLCHVEGGIITNQESLALPAELADAQVESTPAPPTQLKGDGKNITRSGRVMYTAPYSNVRITAKEPKSLKLFPIPSAPKRPPVTVAVAPVLQTSTTALPPTTSTTPQTTSTTTTTSSTTSTTANLVPHTSPDDEPEIEESEPSSSDDVVTEAGEDDVTEDTRDL